MKYEVEHEKRVMLTKEQYLKICKDEKKITNVITSYDITNYYFENDDCLLNKHIVLRIRVTNENIYEIHLKIKGKNGDEEYHERINQTDLITYLSGGLILCENMFRKIQSLGINKNLFYSKASLKTKRFEIKYNDYLLIIDKNTYLDIIDYNLEIESNSNDYSEKMIKLYCNKYGMVYDENYLSKTRRVFKRMC